MRSMGEIRVSLMLMQVVHMFENRDSAGGIAVSYRLDSRGIRVGVPVGARFSSSSRVQTGHGAYPVSYPIGTGGYFPGGKATGA
jgi:hypothetical protein